MFRKLFSARRINEQAHSVYNSVVEEARDPRFYKEPFGVDDSVEGRFELILVHLFLADRVMSKGEDAMSLRRAVRELLVKDMDRSLREMGIGDMSISKQMKKVGAALIARLASLENAMSKPTEEDQLAQIQDVLDRNMDFGIKSGSEHLARHVLDQANQAGKKRIGRWKTACLTRERGNVGN